MAQFVAGLNLSAKKISYEREMGGEWEPKWFHRVECEHEDWCRKRCENSGIECHVMELNFRIYPRSEWTVLYPRCLISMVGAWGLKMAQDLSNVTGYDIECTDANETWGLEPVVKTQATRYYFTRNLVWNWKRVGGVRGRCPWCNRGLRVGQHLDSYSNGKVTVWNWADLSEHFQDHEECFKKQCDYNDEQRKEQKCLRKIKILMPKARKVLREYQSNRDALRLLKREFTRLATLRG